MTDKRSHLTQKHLEALVAPRTREVYDAFNALGEMSVVQLQARLKNPSKTAYYQVEKLVRVGLLRPVGSHEGAVVYGLTDPGRTMPRGFQGLRYEVLAAKGVAATLKRTIRNFGAAAEATASDPGLADDQCILTATLALSPDDREAFRDDFRKLLDRYRRKEDPSAGPRIGVTFVTTPLLESD